MHKYQAIGYMAGIFGLFACNSHSHPDKNIFRYNESSGITSLDPVKATNLPNIWPVQQLYEGLTLIDSNGTLQPCLATSWKVDDSLKTYHFELKPTVFFHQDDCFKNKTRKMTAEDIVYSYQRVLNSSSAWMFENIEKNPATGELRIDVLDSFHLVIHLKDPSFTFPQMLAMPPCAIVPKEAVETYGADFRRHPVGTGPFLLKAWHENEKLILHKNPYYHVNGIPKLDGIAISLLKDKQTALLEFIRGNFDLISGIDAAYKDELLTGEGNLDPKYKDQIHLQKLPYLNTEYLGILLDSVSTSPLQNLHIRKALNYAVDRTRLIAYIRNGIGTPGHAGIVPPSLWNGAKPTFGYQKNDSLFLSEIKASGYGNPQQVPSFTLNADVAYTDVCTYLVHEWNDLGLQVKLEIMDRPTLKSEMAKGNLSFFRASWIADYPDAENYLSLFYGPLKSPVGPNYTHYQSTYYDALFEKTKISGDQKMREAQFMLLDQWAMEQSSIIILYYDQVVRFTNKRVRHLPSHPMNHLDLKKVEVN
jgi:oligopeptide transport system substrate-binding protein